MNVVLVPPPHITHNNKNREAVVHPPMGLLCIASVAIDAGYKVSICDLNIARRQRLITAKRIWDESATDYILSFKPDVVGFGTLCSSFPASLLIAKNLKKRAPSIPIVFGGPQSTLVYRDLLNEIPEVDFVLTGESDYNFTTFLQMLKSNKMKMIPGLAMRMKKNIESILDPDYVDINSLPIPAYDLWPIKEVIEKGWYNHQIPIDAGRGCPFTCYYCSSSLFFKRNFRIKNTKRLIKEIELLNSKYGINSFKMTHDNFTVNSKKVIEFCNAIRKIKIPNLRWGCSSRIDTIDDKLLDEMKSSGCTGIFFGIETGTQRMQKIIKKNLNLKTFEPTIYKVIKSDLQCNVSTMVGFPEEKWTDVQETIKIFLRFAGVQQVHPQIHILSPQPGTEVMNKYHDQLRLDNWYPDRAYFNSKVPKAETELIKLNSNLFSGFYYIPNKNVERKTLVYIVEFSSLLVGSLPGITEFIRNLKLLDIDLIHTWINSCVKSGLTMPKSNGFFINLGYKRAPYLLELLNILEKRCNKKVEKNFVLYWKTLLKTWAGDGFVDYPDIKLLPSIKINTRSSVSMDSKIILTKPCNFVNLDYNIESTIKRWKKYGEWNWPDKKKGLYIAVKHQKNVGISHVPRMTYLVGQWCNGRFTIRELECLLNSLVDSETEELRKTIGSKCLTAIILSNLGKMAGLRKAS